jgi:PilZ domain-containing protein
LLDQDLPVRVRDIGLGGFSIETMEPLPPDREHRVRFISQDDWSTILPARLANCRPSCAEDGSPLYVAGFAFVDDGTPEMKRTVAVLVEKVTVVNLYGQV